MNGKNIVLIGGNSGIGKELAEALKAKGANLFLYSKSGDGTTAPWIRLKTFQIFPIFLK